MKRNISFFLICILLCGFPSISYSANSTQNTELYLYVGSSLIISNGEIIEFDSSKANNAPLLVNEKILVPLRVISEHISKKVADNKKNLDELVSLREVCENDLGLKVDYKDNVVSILNTNTKLNDEKITEVSGKIGGVLKVSSLEQLETLIKTANTNNLENNLSNGTMLKNSNMNYSSSESAMAMGGVADSGSSNSFSQTNAQVDGIDEGDIIKTDGKNIYIASQNKIAVISADSGNMEIKNSIILSQNTDISEMYIDTGRIIVIGTRREVENFKTSTADKKSLTEIEISSMTNSKSYIRNKIFSFVNVYDTSNNTLIKSYETEGYLNTSRKNDKYVYIISDYHSYEDNIIPLYSDTAKGVENQKIDINNIMYTPNKTNTNYLTVSVIDTKDPSIETKYISILDSGYNTYMNQNSLYITGYGSINNISQTNIIKFNINKNIVSYAASGLVEGNILNQFSLDEYKGNLRIATTTQNLRNSTNNLFVLDKNLNLIGKIENLAKGERIYAVRFMGDKGYIVTFKNIDPLFIADLSNPNLPKITGELKVPGFSNYLHPVYENILLGIGYDTENLYKKNKAGEEIIVNTVKGGIKLSLFDVSDMGKPKEIDSLVLGSSGSYTEATYNHKAIMYKLEDGLVGFDTRIQDDDGIMFNGAVLVEMKPSGFVSSTELSIDKNLNTSGEFYNRRLIYIDNTLYYIRDSMLISYDLKTKNIISNLSLGFSK